MESKYLKLGIVLGIMTVVLIGFAGASSDSDIASVTSGAKLDLAFTIDETGSMWDDIDEVQSTASSLVDSIMARAPDSRVGIVGFRDFTDSPMYEDYSFSSSKSTITSNINMLSASGGDDWPEAVYEALMRTISGSAIGGWRGGASKVIILMGDAPPHVAGDSSEYVYDMDDVVKAAKAKDIIICTIIIGSDSEATTVFEELASKTGCSAFTADTASEVTAAVDKAVESAIEFAEDDTSSLDTSGCCCFSWLVDSASATGSAILSLFD